MHVIDLSHPITSDIPVYPGDPSPSFEIFSTYERDGFRQTMIHMGSHTGTHVDAPSHLYAHNSTLGNLHLSQFIGSGFVIDCSSLRPGEKITMEHVAHFWPAADRADFLLFRTGWDRYWGKPKYYQDFPVLSFEAAHYVSSTHNRSRKGIGIDAPSIDAASDSDLTLHRIILGKGLVVVENLTGLDKLNPSEPFTFCAMPLPYHELEGSPVRAAALL